MRSTPFIIYIVMQASRAECSRSLNMEAVKGGAVDCNITYRYWDLSCVLKSKIFESFDKLAFCARLKREDLRDPTPLPRGWPLTNWHHYKVYSNRNASAPRFDVFTSPPHCLGESRIDSTHRPYRPPCT
jgi:hypothetical protein